jgi:hypothetical protein
MTREGGDSSRTYVPCPSSNKGDRGYTWSLHALQGEKKKNEANKRRATIIVLGDINSQLRMWIFIYGGAYFFS